MGVRPVETRGWSLNNGMYTLKKNRVSHYVLHHTGRSRINMQESK